MNWQLVLAQYVDTKDERKSSIVLATLEISIQKLIATWFLSIFCIYKDVFELIITVFMAQFLRKERDPFRRHPPIISI